MKSSKYAFQHQHLSDIEGAKRAFILTAVRGAQLNHEGYIQITSVNDSAMMAGKSPPFINAHSLAGLE